MDMVKIREAAVTLDPANDAHWTANGEAKLDTLRFKLGASLSREEFDAAMPGFNRESLRAHLSGLPRTESANGSGAGAAESQVESKQSEVAPAAEGETSFENSSEAVRRADEEVQRLQRIQEEVGGRLTEAIKIQQAARDAHNKVFPPMSNADTISAYLKSQIEIGQRRSQARATLATAGVSLRALQEVTGMSKLDQAFARRRKPPIGG